MNTLIIDLSQYTSLIQNQLSDMSSKEKDDLLVELRLIVNSIEEEKKFVNDMVDFTQSLRLALDIEPSLVFSDEDCL